jgi:hypothetical protein
MTQPCGVRREHARPKYHCRPHSASLPVIFVFALCFTVIIIVVVVVVVTPTKLRLGKENVMQVVELIAGAEYVFTIEDQTGDGMCCILEPGSCFLPSPIPGKLHGCLRLRGTAHVLWILRYRVKFTGSFAITGGTGDFDGATGLITDSVAANAPEGWFSQEINFSN